MRVEFPGFFDLQVNGFAGVDFNEPAGRPEDLHRAVEALAGTGVTRFLPTLVTGSFERFAACAHWLVRSGEPAIAGLHLEGPYISPLDGPRGAHLREHVRLPSVEDFRRRQEAAEGRIVLVTLAPETEGALSLIEYLVANRVCVAIGHSAAVPAQIRDAIQAGARLSTHLGNGCAPQFPRHPNLLWEQLAADALSASLIVDGHHLPPATVKTMVRAKTPARTVLISDAVAAAGRPAGQYRLGERDVVLDDSGRVTLAGQGTLAGSSLLMPVAVANTVRFTGLPLAEVLPMATTQPAALVGLTPAGRLVADWDEANGRLGLVKA